MPVSWLPSCRQDECQEVQLPAAGEPSVFVFYLHFGHVHLGRVGENKIESSRRYIFFMIIEIMTLSLKNSSWNPEFFFFIWAPLIIKSGGRDSEKYCCKGRAKQQKHSFKVTLQELSVQHHHSSAQNSTAGSLSHNFYTVLQQCLRQSPSAWICTFLIC